MNHSSPYPRLFGMAVLSFAAMYALMYAMVDVFGNVYMSLNQAYMAGLMTAPMVVIELALMGAMYRNKSLSWAIVLVSVAVGVACFFLIRMQTAIGDEQFVRSMIPHHAGALLMCAQARLSDLELQELCRQILAGQQREIDQMEAILKRL